MLATPLETATLPPGIRSRFVRGVDGLDIHILEAGYAPADRPLVLLLHGFPVIAYSWRKVMPALAEAGFHAVAPDQRGYGRTTGWSPDFDTDLRPWHTLNAVRDHWLRGNRVKVSMRRTDRRQSLRRVTSPRCRPDEVPGRGPS